MIPQGPQQNPHHQTDMKGQTSMHDMALKLFQYFSYLLMESPLGYYFKVWTIYYLVVQ